MKIIYDSSRQINFIVEDEDPSETSLKDVQFYDIYRTYGALKGRAHKFQFQI